MRRLVLLVWLAGLALAGLVILRTPLATDMSAFLPQAPTPAQRMLVDQLRQGVVSRLALASIEGAPPQTLASLSRTLAARLRADRRFGPIGNGERAGLGPELDLLRAHRYLLSPAVTAQRFSEVGLHAALLDDMAMLDTDLAPLVKQGLAADPTGETLALLRGLSGRAHPRSQDGVWFTADGGAAVLTVAIRAPGLDIDAQEQALGAIRAAFRAARSGLPGAGAARLVLTGPPVFAVASRARIKGDAERLSIVATLLVALVLTLAYRSGLLLLLGLLPVASGAAAGVAAVGLVYGFVHGITLGFGVTLIGEAVDYAVYLFTQTPPGGSPRATLPRIWPILRLGMLTSVCGFSAMLLSDFVGFAQLGLFTIAGLLTALAVTRFVLPALLPGAFAARGALAAGRPLMALIRNRARLRPVALALILAAALSIAWHGPPFWQDGLSSMSPIPASELATDTRLRAALGAPDARFLLVASAADRDHALQSAETVAARLRPWVASGLLTGFDTPSRLLPSAATQLARRASLPAPATLEGDLLRAAAGTGLRADIFAPFLAAVEAARTGPLLRRSDLDGTGLGLQLDTLLVPAAGGWTALLPLAGVTDAARLATVIAGWGPDAPLLLDLRRQSDALMTSYLGEAITLSLAGSLVIVALLAASLRSAGRIFAVVMPLAAAVLCTASADLAVAGRLSIFNLFGLLLVVAIGSNYALFLEAGDPDPARLAASLSLTNLCTVIGFGVLALSAVPVLHGIGATVAIGTFASLVFAALLGRQRA